MTTILTTVEAYPVGMLMPSSTDCLLHTTAINLTKQTSCACLCLVCLHHL